MAGIEALSSGSGPPLQVSRSGEDEAQSARPIPREQQLAQQLDERLVERLSRIRARLLGRDGESAPNAPNPPGTGQSLDILA